MPSPEDVPAITGILAGDEARGTRHSDDKEPFAALAFKIATDPFVGTLTFFRVYSGVLKSGDTVFNPVKGKKERIGRMLQMHSNDREEIKEVRAGDIAAAVGLKDVTTGDTLCDPANVITLERMEFPEPVISVAVEPRTKADQEKMGVALSKLAKEDPSFRVQTDEESGQTIISGMGELHLDIIVDRMKREFKVEANVGKPQVAYRETISRKPSSRKASSCASPAVAASTGTFSCAWSPCPAAQAMSSLTKSSAARCRRSLSVRSIRVSGSACSSVCWAGYPVVDIKVTLYDGSYHDVDSIGDGIQDCGIHGFRGRRRECRPGASGTDHAG